MQQRSACSRVSLVATGSGRITTQRRCSFIGVLVPVLLSSVLVVGGAGGGGSPIKARAGGPFRVVDDTATATSTAYRAIITRQPMCRFSSFAWNCLGTHHRSSYGYGHLMLLWSRRGGRQYHSYCGRRRLGGPSSFLVVRMRRYHVLSHLRGGAGDTERSSNRLSGSQSTASRDTTTKTTSATTSPTSVSRSNHSTTAYHHTATNTRSTSASTSSKPSDSDCYRYRVYLAVGSNLGYRYQNIYRALQLLTERTNSLWISTSFLHETQPMYVTDQPAFLNGVIELYTNFEPIELLQQIKIVESELGRNVNSTSTTIRNGPRPIDLDILYMQRLEEAQQDADVNIVQMDTEKLTIPHPRIAEREFVLLPFVEVAGPDLLLPIIDIASKDNSNSGHEKTNDDDDRRTRISIGECLRRLQQEDAAATNSNAAASSQPTSTSGRPVRVLPLPRGRLLYWNETLVMGILNVTPDSFSDGGQFVQSIEHAMEHARLLEKQGAAVIDVGGESTRPGAKEVAIEEELERTIPVIEGIRKESDIPISIDTRHAIVARKAVLAGADIVNDVSGGTFDPDMLPTAGQLGVPMIVMHMRGTPETMQSMTEYTTGIVEEVAQALARQSDTAAREHGVHRWLQIVDPGIGFAKDLQGNLHLLRNIRTVRSYCRNLPILLGTSRKGFIGKLANVSTVDRDPGTIASCVAALCLENTSHSLTGCNILRVHNVADCKQGTSVMDAILRRGDCPL